MESLPTELLVQVMAYLVNIPDSLHFLATCQTFHRLGCFFRITQISHIDNASCYQQYYHCLTNVLVKEPLKIYPQSLNQISIIYKQTDIVNFHRSMTNSLPSHLQRLEFGRYFNQPLKGCLPKNLTHLVLGGCFNQPLQHNLSSNVTHLTLTKGFEQSKTDIIPASVTHLQIVDQNQLSAASLAINRVSLVCNSEFENWKQSRLS